MLWTIAIVLFVLWLLGMLTSTTIGGLIHDISFKNGSLLILHPTEAAGK